MNNILCIFISCTLAINLTVINIMKTEEKTGRTEWKLAGIVNQIPDGTTIKGKPCIVDGKYGRSVEFNGSSDVIFIDRNPVSGLHALTIEVIFQPLKGGGFEQRFLHLGETQGDRILLELRATESHWYFDAFISTGEEKCTLIDPERLHPLNEWYHIAYVINNGLLETYVNGIKELEGKIVMSPVNGNKTSIGARQNEVSWFRGSIFKIRFTTKALAPKDFIKF